MGCFNIVGVISSGIVFVFLFWCVFFQVVGKFFRRIFELFFQLGLLFFGLELKVEGWLILFFGEQVFGFSVVFMSFLCSIIIQLFLFVFLVSRVISCVFFEKFILVVRFKFFVFFQQWVVETGYSFRVFRLVLERVLSGIEDLV